MEVDSSITVRPYHDTDVPDLVELFARVFNKSISAEHWRWKLALNRAPGGNVWLAVSADKPVFQYAGIAQRYHLLDREVVGIVSVDTMTHPDFRRRGLLTKVATQAYAAWREGGAGFVIGLPNQQWGSRAQALGWIELFPLHWAALPIRPEVLLAHKLKAPWLRHFRWASALWMRLLKRRLQDDPGLEITDVVHADLSFDELWMRLRDQQAFAAVRDSAWVNWRFLTSPLRRYSVLAARRGTATLGYVAYRTAKTDTRVSIHLAELIAANDDTRTRDRLLAALMERARAMGADVIVTLALPDTPHEGWLRRRGFFRGPGFSVQLVPLATALPLERLKDRREWLLSGADFDVI
jgi:hypothetical protein